MKENQRHRKVSLNLRALPWKFILAGVLLALLAGCFGELCFNFQSLANPRKKGSVLLDLGDVSAKGMELSEGRLVSKGKKAAVTLTFPRQYVNKLFYTYSAPNLNVDGQAVVKAVDGYGGVEAKVIPEKNSVIHTSSVISVREETEEIRLEFPGPTDGFAITSIGISDEPSYSKMRFLFFALLAALVYLLIVCKRTVEHFLERMFLIVALPVGLLMILGLSPREAGWDEHIHFYRAYSLVYDLQGKDTMPVGEHFYDYMNTGAINEPFYFPRSQEENAQERAYGEEGRREALENPALFQETDGLHIYSLSYLPQALMIGLALVLKAPFWVLFATGRLGNLLCYCTLAYFAIRHMKRGRGILTVVALFPTTVFLASVYSYDAFINGCFLLGISYLMGEVMEREKPLSYRNLGIFAAAIVLGSLPKAVYAPMLLLGLLVPAKRFRCPRDAWVFRGIFVAGMLALLSTFVMPTVASDNMQGDARGGDTNITQQMALIFAHPLAYAKLVLSSIRDTFFNYTLGSGVAGALAYRGNIRWGAWIAPFVVFAVLGDNTRRYSGFLTKGQKAFTGILLFGVVGLIWTALYLSFTPVGLQQINGVQARYYIPLLVPFYLILNSSWIVNRMPEKIYHRILLGGSLFFLLDAAWTGVVSMCL